jgi:hypothetical protein
MQKENNDPSSAQPELSQAWQELLGHHPGNTGMPALPGDVTIPTLASDPWSELLHVKGVEIVDLQTVHLQMSDQDLEQVLQVMQEQSDQHPGGANGPNPKQP